MNRSVNRNKRDRYQSLIPVIVKQINQKQLILVQGEDSEEGQLIYLTWKGSFQVILYKMIRFLSRKLKKHMKLAKIVKISILKWNLQPIGLSTKLLTDSVIPWHYLRLLFKKNDQMYLDDKEMQCFCSFCYLFLHMIKWYRQNVCVLLNQCPYWLYVDNYFAFGSLFMFSHFYLSLLSFCQRIFHSYHTFQITVLET